MSDIEHLKALYILKLQKMTVLAYVHKSLPC
jgi:hypothetical protein